jgi:hypothetical protein
MGTRFGFAGTPTPREKFIRAPLQPVMMRSLPLLATSCAIGLSIGFVAPFGKRPAQSPAASDAPQSEARDAAQMQDEKWPNTAETEGIPFSDFTREQHGAALLQIAGQLNRLSSQKDLLRLAKALQTLGFEQAALALEDLRASEEFRALRAGGADLVRALLVERIAASDPQAALDRAQKMGDRILLGAALDTMAQHSAADALRAITRLPGRYQIMGMWFVRGLSAAEFSLGPQTLGGSLEEAVAALKTSPGLFLQSQFGAQLRGLLASLASKDVEDPAAAVFKLRGALRELFRAQPGVDAKKADVLVMQRIGEIAAAMQFSGTADVPFAIYNALKENERSDAVAGRVVSRLAKESGVEAAIRFAEERRGDSIPKELALRTFLAISREDPKAGLQWLETLAPGPLRQGVLLAVAYAAIADATVVDPDAGHADALTEGGMRLFSEKTKSEYFSMLAAGDTGSSGPASRSARTAFALLDVPRSVFIEELPVPEVLKGDLWKQSAPVRAK